MIPLPAQSFPFYRIKNILLWMLIVVTASISSCGDKKTDESGLSQQFKPVYDSTEYLLAKNKIDQALSYVQTASQHMSLNPTDRLRKYGILYAVTHKVKGDNEKALKYADSMIVAASQVNDKAHYIAFLADANFARGDALFDLGRFTESYANYYQGYLLGHNSTDNCTLSSYMYRMGMITYKQANYPYATTYFKQSFDLNKSCKDEFVSFFRQQEVLDNIALSYRNRNLPDSALAYFNGAIKYIDDNAAKYPDRADILEVARAVVYGNQAEVLIGQKKFQEAISLLKKSIATNLKRGNDNHDAQLSEVKLAELYINLHQNAAAVPVLKAVRAQLDSLPSADAEAGWNLMTGDYYKALHEDAKALPYIEKYHHLKDSLSVRSRMLKESNVNEQLSNLEKQHTIINLVNTQRIYKYTVAIFVAMSSIIILLIYRNWKRSRREMDMVSTLNRKITIQKNDLERTLVDLEHSSQEKDRILRTVAHDLRNPLGGIASLTDAMIDEAEYTADQLDQLRIIKETAYDSLELINEILEATSGSAVEYIKHPVDINNLLNNSVELMRFKAAEKNQKITLNMLEAPEQLFISREKIWRVLSNLISNAIKFSPVGAEIKVDIVDDISDVQISVNDHGIGIPDKIKNKVFNMFTDAQRPGTLGEKSFGLGLSICRQIIEKHQGRIWFESDAKTGTTFFIRLSKTSIPAEAVV